MCIPIYPGERISAKIVCSVCKRVVGKIYFPIELREDGKPIIESYDDCTKHYPDEMVCANCQEVD